MTIEQKVQRYNEALKRAKKLYEQGTITESLSYVFPELKESEDEKIRKALVDFMTIMWGNQQDDICGVNVEDAIAWIEKQGEQKPNDRPAWSEGDETLLSSVINSLLIFEDSGASKMKIDWLTSIKQRIKGE